MLPKIVSPTPEEVQKYHDIFLTKMEQLYNDNRAAYGMGKIPLRII